MEPGEGRDPRRALLDALEQEADDDPDELALRPHQEDFHAPDSDSAACGQPPERGRKRSR